MKNGTLSRSKLSSAKQTLLEQRLRGEAGGPGTPVIRRTSRAEPIPASFAQQQLWFLDQLSPGNAAYNLFEALRIQGPLNVSALENSLAEIIRRHEALRTVFATAEAQAVQIVLPPPSFTLPIVDLQNLPETERGQEAHRLTVAEAERPFDLSRDLMLRPVLLRLAPEEHILLAAMHHIASDGWSLGVFYRELSALYDRFTQGGAPLPELPIQYTDFAMRQRQQMQGKKLEKELAYWKKQLAGAAEVLELPTDRPRPAEQTFRGAQHWGTWPVSLTKALKALSRQQEVTLFMTLQAAFKVLLHRYTRQTDIVVGSPISGRTQVETEDLIGFFINILVLRTDLSGNPTFEELLRRVRAGTLNAYAHQDLPLELLVREMKPGRSSGHMPLFQVMFVLQSAPSHTFTAPGLKCTRADVDNNTAKFDLTLSVTEDDRGLTALWEYNRDLFDAATIQRMEGQFQTLLEGIVAHPQKRLSELPLLTEAERQRLLTEWSGAVGAYPAEKTIPQLFEEQVEHAPDAVALVFGDQRLTYQELNARANQLAGHLQEFGVGPDVLVCVCLERSLELIVTLLGILKAGGAYVALDPAYPKELLAFMLQDTQTPVLVTQERLLQSLPDFNAQDVSPRVICLDTSREVIERQDTANPHFAARHPHSNDLAYVSFTSGSTGKPKGVCVTHRGVVRLVKETNYARLNASEVFLQFAPIPFDASTFEIWGCLLNGARLVIFPPEAPSLAELGEAIQKYQVTTLWLTAGLFHQMVEEQLQSLKGVRQLLAGGDVLSPTHVKKAAETLSGCELINGYGPTENTTFTCCCSIRPPVAVDRSISIGRPIANTQVYVLDDSLEPVPIGVPGELYAGGAGLARGYLNRPELTAERFIPHPFNPDPQARLYKTGDLARWLPDGQLEFLGRIDCQVKVRGFRIELGEIETVLSQHDAVAECVVVAREEPPGHKQLVAYVVNAPKATAAAPDLRQFLKEKLPHYMVPSLFVFLESLPLTENGKVDRRALPAPGPARPQSEASYVVPQIPLEQTLAEIWAAVLRLDRVGVQDNFFELGGHSLLAITVAARIRDVLQVDVPLRYFFQAPTVAEMAMKIKQMKTARQEGNLLLANAATVTPEEIPMTRQTEQAPGPALSETKQALLEKRLRGTVKGRAQAQITPRCACKNAAPLSFAQQRLWFLDQLQPNSPLYNIPSAIRLRGRLDLQAVQRAITAIVARHEALRTRFASVEGEPHQVIVEPAAVEVPLKDLTHCPEIEREGELQRFLAAQAKRPFDLSCDLMLRASLVRLNDSEHVLFLNMHHIAADAWSLGIFFHEFGLLYEAFVSGQTASLPDLPIQYADYAIWQRQWLQKDMLERQLSYWKRQLAGAPDVLPLPVDRPRPAAQTYCGAQQVLELPPSLAGALQSLSRREGVTLFMLLLAAWKTLVHRYTRQMDLLMGTPVAGRNQMETEGLIGFFVNTLVLRSDFGGNPSFREFLQQVRKVTLEAFAHQDLPFEKLVEELRPERAPSYTPLIQAMFVLQNAATQKLRLPELDISPLEVNTATAKFDLTLSMTETPEGLRAELEYNQDLFNADTISRVLGNFQTLLEGIVAHPERRLSDLPLLTASEQHRLLLEWNQTRTDYPKEKLIHQLFEEQAERTPDAVAVAHEAQQLSYAELNARANQLAHYLKKLGAGPEVRVGVYLERSPDLIVALLAILKSGSAYLPMDRAYPKERIEFMVEDAEAPLLITEHRFVDELPSTAAKVIYLDVDCRNIAAEPNDNLPCAVTSEQMAYLIYTSGSTGKPKAACIPHRAVNRLVMNTDFVQLGPCDVMAQVSTCSFDAATWEIWGALLHGARLVIITKDIVLSPGEFSEQLREQQITAMFLTTPLFHELASGVPGAFGTLRCLLVGGAVAEPRWMAEVLKNNPPKRLFNAYGPTETTTFAACYEVKSVPDGAATVPIGRPIANTRLYVLDEHLQPVPIGAQGELYIGGDGVGSGYLRRPELTAERFIPDPFSSEPGARLYKSGDLVRYLPDGNIEFIGRMDLQVKIRGFRVELEEVESVLGQHPAVRECAVMARADTPGEKRLVAYVVLDNQRPPKLSELRDFLGTKLPDYMVPSIFVPMDALPLNPNRKVNRLALPAPDAMRREVGRLAPRDALELQLTTIWENVLGVHPIGIHDKFFELGGHSLLAVKLLAQMEKAFGRKLSLAALFQFQTIEQMAAILRKDSAPAQRSSVVEVQPDGSKPPIFFVHGVGGGMFWGYINLSRHLGADQPVYALRSRGLDGQEEWSRIEEMAVDYVCDLRAFQPQGPYYLGGYCFGGNVAYEMARQLHAQGEKVALLALINCAPPNSSYSRIAWTPWFVMKFLGNLFWWIWNFFHWPANQRRGFFGWKMRLLNKAVRRLFHPRPEAAADVDVERMVNLSLYPEDQRSLWETHIRALVHYHPKTYPGEVALFRSRGHPLLCSYDAKFGWGDLALGGVNLKFVPGGHERILEEPHVQVIGRELKACLEAAQTRPTSRERTGPNSSEDARASQGDTPEAIPLSGAQQRLWSYQNSHPDEPLQNRSDAWHLKGPLNVAALEQSIGEIVRRHEALRTRFVVTEETPAQIVSANVNFYLEKVDLRALPESHREEEVNRLSVAEATRPFNLAGDLALRVTLFQLAAAEHVLLVVLNPLAADDSSLGIFFSELNVLYEAYCQGKASPLPELGVQYSTFIAELQPALRRNNGELPANGSPAGEAELPFLELMVDHPPAAVGPLRSGMQWVKVPRSVTKALKAVSHKHGVTLFMTLLAALGTLVYRSSRQDSFLVRTTSPGRNRDDTKNLIGCFDMALTLRFDLSGNPAFEQLLGRVYNLVRDTSERERDLEFPTRRAALSHASSSQTRVAFHFQTVLQPVLQLTGLLVMPWRLPRSEPEFDLNFTFVSAHDDDLTARVEYGLDSFEAATIARWLGRLQTLLENVAAHPDQRISELAVLSSAERRQLLVDWNATEVDHPIEQTYASAFEMQAAKTPLAPAVRFQGVELTYAELDRRANQLAHYLQTVGVGPEVLVAIQIGRSLDFAVGVLAILKAGGAYLPLDSASPPRRLAQILEDSQASFLLARQSDVSQLRFGAAKLICIDDSAWQRQFVDARFQSNPPNAATADNLAYVMYTSGSTGQPKGVQVTHRSLLNHNFAVAKAFHLQPSDRMLQFSSLSFDISVEEIFPTWLSGGLVVMRSAEVLDSPAKFLEFIRQERITILDLPTAFWHQLVSCLSEAVFPPSTRLVVIGGEKASQQSYDAWKKLVPNSVVLINTYGPTEATVTATLQVARNGNDNEVLSIGRPIDNVCVYLLDETLQPVPIGTPGELHIGGVGVARGYLNRPDLTEERFVSNPFRVGPGERLYKTGDLARYQADGTIEFLGRMDEQVKIRGYRVELGDVESALRRYPRIQHCVVLALEDLNGQFRLVAYFVSDGATPVAEGTLVQFLKGELPEYMVPTLFIPLQALPLSAQGKIDRSALPRPDWSRPALEQNFVAPRTPLEADIAGIWCEVLGLKLVGVFDNFFELGGHSLHAMQVAARLREQLQEDVPLSELFENPTVASLAGILLLRRRRKPTQSIPPAARTDRLPLSFDQQRLWFLNQLEPENPVYNIPQAIRLVGKLNVPALESSLNEIVRRHEALRTTFHTVDGQPVQSISPLAPVALAKVDLRLIPAAQRAEALRQQMMTEARRPFDLTRDLMLRATLLQMESAEQVLLVTLHHIAADAWSVGVLLKELVMLYEALSQGEPSSLPALPIQYADFAVWQRQSMQGETLEKKLAYWEGKIRGAPVLLELPTDRPRPAVQKYAGARQPLTLSRPLTEALSLLSRQENCTLYMTLLAAFQTFISRYTGRADVVVGSPIANRTRAEVEKLIGFFVNTLVLRAETSENPTFRKFLRQVRSTTLDAYAHQDLPFEKLVERLQPKRDQSYQPLFQVMFILQNVPVPALETAGLSWRPFEVDTNTSKFDLTLELSETAEGLAGWLEYSTDLFDPATVDRMASHFRTLLEGIAANPNQRLSELPILPETERHQLLVEWNETARDYPRNKCIHELFEEQAARTPSVPAVIWQDNSLTYQQLNQRAEQLAERLRRLGVGPEVRVGFCVERSLDMVVGILAILKAGGAYVPMDPAYPEDRLKLILEDARAPLLVTQQKLAANFHTAQTRIFCLDSGDSPQVSKSQVQRLTANPQSANLAYVIYTSGSTGRPKGVAIEHRSAVSLVHWAREVFSSEELAGVLFSTSVCFDLSVFELFVPLSWGGTVILAENALQLPSLSAANKVTLINTVPSAIAELLRVNGIPASVRTVNLAGEPLAQSLVEQLYATPNIRKVYDLYGPTEDTVYSTFALRTPDGPATIGRPLSNKEIYLLDAGMQPVPMGVPGELHIGGAGLARGYLHQDELTARKFVGDPFHAQKRLYKTGDLGRYLPDGRIQFLGRIDHQVKIRGYRIEPGEIETQLRKHPQVREAVVIASEDRFSDKRLLAYVVPNKQTPTVPELRAFLKKTLPEYMVPSLFVSLHELPQTPNGKVDRKALLRLAGGPNEVEKAYTPPRTTTETLLAQIWCEVLNLQRAGVDDNFFDLGGHSLMIAKVLARLREAVQVELPMRAMFEAPTIATLALVVEAALIEEIKELSEEEAQRLEAVTQSFSG